MANEDLCAGNVPPIYPPKGKCQCQEEISELRDEMLGRLTDKQDKLTAGEGITIEKVGSDTVISSSSSIRIFRPVDVLPDASEADENSIYLTPKEGGGVDEWNVVEEGGQKVWNKFGEADIDLTGYVKDEDVTKEYLLERLDYEEIPVSMTTSEETKDYIFLGREEVEPPSYLATGPAGELTIVPGPNQTASLPNLTLEETTPLEDGNNIRVTFINPKFDGNDIPAVHTLNLDWFSVWWQGRVHLTPIGNTYLDISGNIRTVNNVKTGNLRTIDMGICFGPTSGTQGIFTYDSVTFELIS